MVVSIQIAAHSAVQRRSKNGNSLKLEQHLMTCRRRGKAEEAKERGERAAAWGQPQVPISHLKKFIINSSSGSRHGKQTTRKIKIKRGG